MEGKRGLGTADVTAVVLRGEGDTIARLLEAPTYTAITANFKGPNPFPVDVIVGKDGVIRYATHEYDPDAMVTLIDQLLEE